MNPSLVKPLENCGFVKNQWSGNNVWVYEYYEFAQYTIQVVIKREDPINKPKEYSSAVHLYFDSESLSHRDTNQKFDNINDGITCAVAMRYKMKGDLEAQALQD